MIELPEALNLAGQLKSAVSGKRVMSVLPPTKPHKFCWFAGDPEKYGDRLVGSEVTSAEGFGGFVEIIFSCGERLCFNDGVNVRLVSEADAPRNYQLLVVFDDSSSLVFTVAMYGGIYLHDGSYDNTYYLKSFTALSPFADGFEAFFYETFSACKSSLGAKAFLATEQRFAGLGNGVLQDILFCAGINPKRKIATLGKDGISGLFESTVSVLADMTANGGRDTEKDIYGNSGGYVTKMSKNTLATGCAVCGGPIVKEAYLGGSVYYCPHCQQI